MDTAAVQLSSLPESKQENLRRYGYLILEEVREKYQRKMASGAVVATVKASASEIGTALDVPKQVAGRALSALVTLSPGVRRASRSYAFDVKRIPALRRAMKRIQELYTRRAETAAIDDIVSLCGPMTGGEIQEFLASWLGYEPSLAQVNARLDHVDDLVVLPGNGGYLSLATVNNCNLRE